MTIELREYQCDAIAHTHAALRDVRRVVLCGSTGMGKRIMACWWALKIVELGRRLLVVTDRRQLVRQMVDELRTNNISYGVLMADEPTNDDAPVQVASIQTIHRRGYAYGPPADWVLIDEAHKTPEQYLRLLSARYQDSKVVGFTATPVGPHGYSLVPKYFDRIVESVPNTELIRDGWLLPVKVFAPYSPNIVGVKVSNSGEYNQRDLAERVEKCVLFADLFKWWEPYSKLQTIVFAPLVVFARGLAAQFVERGYSAEVIEAATTRRERVEIIQRFVTGETRVLSSVDVLREGFDAPIAQCGIDLQPNKQFRGYWQKIGRIKRPHENQDHAIWIDFAGNSWRFLHPDEDPDWLSITEKLNSQEMVRRKLEKEANKDESPARWHCPVCSYEPSPGEITSGACPNCGAKIRRTVRRVRMEDGRMALLTPKKKQNKAISGNQQRWDKCRYMAMHLGKTLNWAGWYYKSGPNVGCGKWPDAKHLKNCPARGSEDWFRLPDKVYPWMRRARRKKVN